MSKKNRQVKKKKAARENTSTSRLYFVAFSLFFFASILVVRLLYIQLWESSTYSNMADKQYILKIPSQAHRGLIYDRNREYLALNEPCISIGLDKRQMKGSALHYAGKLAGATRTSSSKLRKRIEGVKGTFVWILRRIDADLGPGVAALELPGILVQKDTRRVYPHHEVASHILGFTDPDNRGLEGVEFGFNEKLRGEDGYSAISRDGRGRAVPENILTRHESRDGSSIMLTIDYIIQSAAAEELRKSIHEYNARKGTVVICNPQNGEILAIANEPNYNPNNPGASLIGNRRNRALTDPYEPGSTFKIVTFAGIFENKLKKESDKIFCENGIYLRNGRRIKDTKKLGLISVEDILRYSSNIGTAKLAEVLGKEKMFAIARSFGFGSKSNIALPGETAGILRDVDKWSNYTLASMSIGQEISASALQMTMAYAAIANGGFLLEPKILKERIDVSGERHVEPETKRKRIISKTTASKINRMLVRVVEKGTGKPARIKGLKIAGKTGTAQKALPNGKGYSSTEFISNFAGYFPANKPKYLIYVTLDTNKKNQWGKYSAATFKRIAQRIILQEERILSRRITESSLPQKKNAQVVEVSGHFLPNLKNRNFELAKASLETFGLVVKTKGNGYFIKKQSPAPGTLLEAGMEVSLELFETNRSDGFIKMPSLLGLSVREALNRLAIQNLEPVVYGSGKVVKQKPSPGTMVRSGIRCVIECNIAASAKPVFSGTGA